MVHNNSLNGLRVAQQAHLRVSVRDCAMLVVAPPLANLVYFPFIAVVLLIIITREERVGKGEG